MSANGLDPNYGSRYGMPMYNPTSPTGFPMQGAAPAGYPSTSPNSGYFTMREPSSSVDFQPNIFMGMSAPNAPPPPGSNPNMAYYDAMIAPVMKSATEAYRAVMAVPSPADKSSSNGSSNGSSAAPSGSSGGGAQPPAKPSMDEYTALQIIQNNQRVLDTKRHGGSPDKAISKSDLQAALDDPNTPPEVKEAINSVINSPQFWKQIDPDGDERFGYDALNQLIANVKKNPNTVGNRPMNTDLDALETLQRDQSYLDLIRNRDDYRELPFQYGYSKLPVQADRAISREDLEAALKSDQCPADTKAAIRRLLENGKFWEAVDSDGDNRFTYDDLQRGIDALKQDADRNFGTPLQTRA